LLQWIALGRIFAAVRDAGTLLVHVDAAGCSGSLLQWWWLTLLLLHLRASAAEMAVISGA